jgi:hydroxyacyl-ACP dehydratase HTD2-like protein with hotdog domain
MVFVVYKVTLSVRHVMKVKEKCVAKCQWVSVRRNTRKTSKLCITHKKQINYEKNCHMNIGPV